jgi:hypothetical protein
MLTVAEPYFQRHDFRGDVILHAAFPHPLLKRLVRFERGNAARIVSCVLTTVLCNQALILKAWGRLEEALELHKKQEALCLELVNRGGLAYCYWNWGLLAREQRDRKTEREKLAAAVDIFTELNMAFLQAVLVAQLQGERFHFLEHTS